MTSEDELVEERQGTKTIREDLKVWTIYTICAIFLPMILQILEDSRFVQRLPWIGEKAT